MSEYAKIESSVVVDVIVSDTMPPLPGTWVLTPYDGQTGKVGIGYKYSEGVFSSRLSGEMNIKAPDGVFLRFTVVGATNPTYQWKKGSDNIEGATSAALLISPSSVGDSGDYSCVASFSGKSLTSDVCTVTVSAS